MYFSIEMRFKEMNIKIRKSFGTSKGFSRLVTEFNCSITYIKLKGNKNLIFANVLFILYISYFLKKTVENNKKNNLRI